MRNDILLFYLSVYTLSRGDKFGDVPIFFMIALRWRTPAADFSFLCDPPGLGLGFGVQLTILSLSFSFKFTNTNTYHP